jgi:spore coat polysaccharide biosynthesis protein SpsF (cytidylyltransferase family)
LVLGCIVQARMGSSRLPGKVMMKPDGKNPIVYHVIKQLQNCKLVDEIVIATTNLPEDDTLANFVKDMEISLFRGSSNDVLDRYYQCAKEFSFSDIVRITSDNPLIDPTIVDLVISKYLEGEFDYVTNSYPRTFPQGTETEVFSFRILEDVWKNAKKPSEREHVTPYIYNNPNKFKIFNVGYSENLSHLRWTVDQKNDFYLVENILKKIKNRPVLMKDILELFEQQPNIKKINENYIMNEGYLKSLNDEKNLHK